jgi:hypothetical protein
MSIFEAYLQTFGSQKLLGILPDNLKEKNGLKQKRKFQ